MKSILNIIGLKYNGISHYSFIIYVQIYLSFILAGMECEYFAKTDRWLVWLFGMLKESIEPKIHFM